MKPSAWIIAGIIVAAGSLWALREFQHKLRVAAPMLPVTFAHKAHQAVNCIACHHDYVDNSGQGLCFDCHKSDPEIQALIETQFHELCWGCHVEKQAEGEDHGPTRQCSACHEADQDP